MTALVTTRSELATSRRELSAPVVLVPTMGALHDGHRALLRSARAAAGPGGSVVVSIFVNPLQFGEAADLERYPRPLAHDMAVCEAEGTDLVFAPPVEEIYPEQQRVTVDPGSMGTVLEGEFRPGHFAGVLTVVLKLFSLIRPDIAVFGEKDAQQLALVRAMVDDFAVPVSIRSVATVRDHDGLALSSRNRFLSQDERRVALAIPRALLAGAEAAGHGPKAVLGAAQRVLDDAGLKPEYLALVDPGNFAFVRDDYLDSALLVIAARVGQTRLIDNVRVERHAADN
jgi:pantoate--beta-alanine ligase